MRWREEGRFRLRRDRGRSKKAREGETGEDDCRRLAVGRGSSECEIFVAFCGCATSSRGARTIDW